MRTEASKNEMELAESLDELRELNRRTVSVDYATMIKKYATLMIFTFFFINDLTLVINTPMKITLVVHSRIHNTGTC